MRMFKLSQPNMTRSKKDTLWSWLSGESGSSNNRKVGSSIPTLTAQKIGELTAGVGGVAVHLLATAGVQGTVPPVHVCVQQVPPWMG